MALFIKNSAFTNPLYVCIESYRKGTANEQIPTEVGEVYDENAPTVKTYYFEVKIASYLDSEKKQKINLKGLSESSSLVHVLSDVPRKEVDDYKGSEMEYLYNLIKKELIKFGEISDT